MDSQDKSSPNPAGAIMAALETVATEVAEGLTNSEGLRAAIGNALTKLGNAGGHVVCADADLFHGAVHARWLWDVAWVTTTGRYYIDVPMACEIAWNIDRESIENSVMRLVVSRARLRVLVFQQASDYGVDECIARIRSLAAAFELAEPSDQYLVAGFAASRTLFMFSRILGR